ncbi:MAG: hypothetical protein QM811_07335 [Pirellulales bacterium]
MDESGNLISNRSGYAKEIIDNYKARYEVKGTGVGGGGEGMPVRPNPGGGVDIFGRGGA